MKRCLNRVLSLGIVCCSMFSLFACGGDKITSENSAPSSTVCAHTYGSKITKEATCKETGIKTYTCSVCGDSYTEEIAKTMMHTYSSEITQEATCLEKGIKTYTCGICNNSYTEEIEKSATHSYVSEVTKEATCNQKGEITHTCEVCGDAYSEEINKSSEHSYTSETTKEPTCQESGLKTYICTVCGDSYTEYLAKTENHSYTSEVTKEATCNTLGVITYTCGLCGDSYTEDMPKTNAHTLSKNNICSTCGYGNTIALNMTEAEKALASNVATNWHKTSIFTGNGSYIIRFAYSTNPSTTQLDKDSLVAIPSIMDIAITNIDGEVVYAAVKEIKTSDFETLDGGLWGSVEIPYSELSDTSKKIEEIEYFLFNPDYFYFGKKERTAPAIIILPTLPDVIYERSYSGDLKTGVRITEISYEINTNSYSLLYFTGEKTYDKEGDLYSRGCTVGYKLYDSEGYLIDSGTYTTKALKVGEEFKNGQEYAFYKMIETGKIYRLELLNVG